MAERKRIALLLGEPDKSAQSNFIEGFLRQTFEYDIDVCVFAMYQMYQDSSNRELGDSKIFSLIPYDSIDAMVVMADTMQTTGVLEQLESELEDYFQGPVLFVDKHSDKFPYIIMDDYRLTKQIMCHLIEEHGYRDIAYLTGKSWNNHSIARLNAYRDSMKEHNLEVRDDRIFFGDFWYTSGESMVDRLLKQKGDLPDAIACANNCMAIGVARALIDRGLQVPGDIAVVGYDYSVEGALSPVPLTSVHVPYEKFGEHAAHTIYSMMMNRHMPQFDVECRLFVGSSCGCNGCIEDTSFFKRKEWETENSYGGAGSKYNSFVEDLMTQNKLSDLFNVISSYTYQLRDVESFALCLNDYWESEETLLKSDNDWKNYTEDMYVAVRYSKVNNSIVTTGSKFNCQVLIPDLDYKRGIPKAYFFTPLFFEDCCMGYAVLSYGNRPCSYADTYPGWIKKVIQGLECMRRQVKAKQQSVRLENRIYVDEGTGLNNYKGLIKESVSLIDGESKIKILAVDIKGLSRINKAFGRDEGDRVIARVGSYIKENKFCDISCCLGNDEFLLVSASVDEAVFNKMREELLLRVEEGNKHNTNYQIEVCIGEAEGVFATTEEFERLINDAVSCKNGNKISEQKKHNVVTFSEEEKKTMEVVRDILDCNKLVYHFQPIVSAKTGEIYSYEALMRSDTEVRVSPMDILKYAEAMNRLEDVEKYTFTNVMEFVENNPSLFKGKKVFINSIPGVSVSDFELENINDSLKGFRGQMVVELTEQAELGDVELSDLKEKYFELGVDTAVDDYGTGYSNVTNLLRYMPKYVKIDRMLLNEIEHSPQKQHFVNEIIEFAHNNNIMALAEGVETLEELEMVIHLGADLIQGYYIAKPSAEVIQSIPVKVRREILQYNLQERYNKNRKLYVAGREFRVSLAKLMAEEYECILITNDTSAYRDFSISGFSGNRSDVILQIADGYHGRVCLDNASLGGKRGVPCINIGEDCEVTLVLQGDNELRSGGIRVPESSKLVVEGEGDLFINCNFDNYFGIGNEMDKRHGDILVEQDGAVEMSCNGTLGVAVGSGLGGNIAINSGKLIINVTGKTCAMVGCISGDTNVGIYSCDVTLDGAIYSGVGIGSIEGKTICQSKHVAINVKLSGIDCVGIGSQKAGKNEIKLHNCSSRIEIHGTKGCCVGSFEGKNNIDVKHAAVNMLMEGRQSIAMGDYGMESYMELENAEINATLHTETEDLFGVLENNRLMKNVRININDNGNTFTA